jgi:predicted dehydrogenase
MALRIGLLGIGKIARDQHIPALKANPAFELVACASRNARVDGVANFPDLAAMLAGAKLDCVSICTPPQAHFDAALTALRAGYHVMLEKPPAATTRQIALLADEATRVRCTLFQTWHSRFAASVDAARDWLCTRELTGGRIIWKEDVHHWHPGQQWIFDAGGFGVFDPGINALSVLTEILPGDVHVEGALLEFPENQQAPIAANVRMRSGATPIVAKLSNGGATLAIDGKTLASDAGLAGEYPRLYKRFAALCAAGKSEVDWRPFQLVADAFLIGERRIVAPHHV